MLPFFLGNEGKIFTDQTWAECSANYTEPHVDAFQFVMFSFACGVLIFGPRAKECFYKDANCTLPNKMLLVCHAVAPNSWLTKFFSHSSPNQFSNGLDKNVDYELYLKLGWITVLGHSFSFHTPKIDLLIAFHYLLAAIHGRNWKRISAPPAKAYVARR